VDITNIDRVADSERSRCPVVYPVPIEEIITSAGVRIGRNYHDGSQSSFVVRYFRNPIIGVNTRTSPRRQRFALAHAYGHLVLATSPYLTVCQSVGLPRASLGSPGTAHTVSYQDEASANWFAGSILMPEDRLRDVLAEHLTEVQFASRDELIKMVAAVFQVSTEAMGWRLISLNLIMA
jgi:Zn-dependent peptidase ImmA (M78 family)